MSYHGTNAKTIDYTHSEQPIITDQTQISRSLTIWQCPSDLSNKVIAVLVNMVFAQPFIEFSKQAEIQHLELFAGDCSVSRSEHADTGAGNRGWVWGQNKLKMHGSVKVIIKVYQNVTHYFCCDAILAQQALDSPYRGTKVRKTVVLGLQFGFPK